MGLESWLCPSSACGHISSPPCTLISSLWTWTNCGAYAVRGGEVTELVVLACDALAPFESALYRQSSLQLLSVLTGSLQAPQLGWAFMVLRECRVHHGK